LQQKLNIHSGETRFQSYY